MIATVASAGLCTVQDGGRPGYEMVGVPTAGAWHRDRYACLAMLLGGSVEPAFPALELVAGDLVLDMHEPAAVAVVGPAEVTVNGHSAAAGVVLSLGSGQQFAIRHVGRGPVYVGVIGWRPHRVLGSCSVDTFSRLGGQPVARGDDLRGERASSDRVGWFLRPEEPRGGPLRLVGLPGGLFDETCASSWRVVSSARSGTRLRSPSRVPSTGSIESFPVLPGTVQVTPDGEAIVLGPDGALTGGYPVVGVVATSDLDRMSCLSPGDEMRFAITDPTSAARAFAGIEAARIRRLVDPSRLS